MAAITHSEPDLFARVSSALDALMTSRGFSSKASEPPDPTSMGAWFFAMESPEFLITASQDRIGDTLGICLGSKIRRKPRAQMRGPWSLHHLRGYIDGLLDHYRFGDPDEQLTWLQSKIDDLLDTSLLNSNDLNDWAVKASRRMFGQRPSAQRR